MAARRALSSTADHPSGQIALFGSPETPEAFKKATQILHCTPLIPISLVQLKMMDAWIAHAISTEPDDKGMWELSIVKLAKDIGFNSNNREYLMDAAEAFMKIIFKWDVMAPTKSAGFYKASVFVPDVEIHPHCIRYSISSHLREVMRNPDIYALVDRAVGRKFTRVPAYKIWQFCCRYERIGHTATVPWEQFRDMILGQEANSATYDQYKFFKSKVLKPAIAEINDIAPIEIDVREGKEGKRVVFIQFTIKRKAGAEKPAAEVDEEARALIGEMVLLRVSPMEARRIVKSKTADEIRAAIAYVKRRAASPAAAIQDVGAYFRAALDGKYAEAIENERHGPSDGAGGPVAAHPAPPNPAADLTSRYQAKRQDEAQEHFAALSTEQQLVVIDRYNAQQTVAALQMTERRTKANQSAFARWLVLELWGKVTERDIADFALADSATEQRMAAVG